MKDLHSGERCVRLLPQMPAEEIDETTFKNDCTKFLG